MATWDVFKSDRLELQRGLATAEVREALGRGDLNDDDLIRPTGAAVPWARIGDSPDLLASEPEQEPEQKPAAALELQATIADEPPPVFLGDDDETEDEEVLAIELLDDEEAQDEAAAAGSGLHDEAELPVLPDPADAHETPYGEFDLNLRETHAANEPEDDEPSSVELVAGWDDDLELVGDAEGAGVVATAGGGQAVEEYDPLEEDEAVAEFSLSRSASERVEELDLAAMVDVAFQMVLFFLVTATTVLYKTLEVPKPNPESSPTAAASQGRAKTLDELKDDFILVEIDPAGVVKVDREPVRAEHAALVDRLRAERERSGRKAMLLSADFATAHKNAVLAYDAANEIGLGIAIARPPSPGP